MSEENAGTDPFIHAQDIDVFWLKTMSVTKGANKLNCYIFYYIDLFSKTKTFIHDNRC